MFSFIYESGFTEVKLFSLGLKVPPQCSVQFLVDLQDLENALLESENEAGSDFILDLLCRLLNGCYGRKDIS